MHRRNMLWGALSAFSAAFAVARVQAATPASEKSQDKDKLKVVYHLSDLDKVAFVIGNIQNHIDGVGGPDNVTLALVVHGPALKAFYATGSSPEVSSRIGQFSLSGIELDACGNTMKAQHITLKDLLPGFVEAAKGGVVKIAELQSKGYLYIRP